MSEENPLPLPAVAPVPAKTTYTESLLEKKDAKKAIEVGIALDPKESLAITEEIDRIRADLERKALAAKLRTAAYQAPPPPETVHQLIELPGIVASAGENPMRPSLETLEGKLVMIATIFQYFLGLLGVGLATYGTTQANLPIACWGAALTAMAQYLSKKIASDFARERTALKQSQVTGTVPETTK